MKTVFLGLFSSDDSSVSVRGWSTVRKWPNSDNTSDWCVGTIYWDFDPCHVFFFIVSHFALKNEVTWSDGRPHFRSRWVMLHNIMYPFCQCSGNCIQTGSDHATGNDVRKRKYTHLAFSIILTIVKAVCYGWYYISDFSYGYQVTSHLIFPSADSDFNKITW